MLIGVGPAQRNQRRCNLSVQFLQIAIALPILKNIWPPIFMKLVQFIYPMFLVALGLHALLLFVPIGGAADPDPVEEDVPLSDLSEQPAPDPAGALPVPDLNVFTEPPDGAAIKPAIAPPPASSAGSSSAVRRAAAPRQPVASAPIRTTTPTARPPARPDPADSAAPSAPSGSPDSPTTHLPDLSAEDQDAAESAPDESRSEEATAEDAASPSATNEPASSLIASASGEPPESLQRLAAAFAQALAYNPQGTDEASAERELTDWQAGIRRQANVDGVENIEPTQIAELTQIRYPIESAEKADGRPFSVCLEKAPHTAEVGILFDSQGQISGEPKLIRSTGYSALNEEIMAAIAKYDDFPDGHQSKAYTFEIEVDYDADACVSLAELVLPDP